MWWERILNWFRSKLTRQASYSLREAQHYRSFESLSSSEFKVEDAKDQNEKNLFIASQKFRHAHQVLQDVSGKWNQFSWLFDYLLALPEKRSTYLTVKQQLSVTVQQFHAARAKADAALIESLQIHSEKTTSVLPEHWPLKCLAQGFDLIIDAKTLDSFKRMKPYIVQAIKGEYPVALSNQQRLARAIYLMSYDDPLELYPDIEHPMKTALVILEELLKEDYEPARLYYADALMNGGRTTEALTQYRLAENQGSLAAIDRLEKLNSNEELKRELDGRLKMHQVEESEVEPAGTRQVQFADSVIEPPQSTEAQNDSEPSSSHQKDRKHLLKRLSTFRKRPSREEVSSEKEKQAKPHGFFSFFSKKRNKKPAKSQAEEKSPRLGYLAP